MSGTGKNASSAPDDAAQAEDEPSHLLSRRTLLAGAAVTAGGAILKRLGGAHEQLPGSPSAAAPVVPDDPTLLPGGPTTPVSARSPFVNPARTPTGVITGSAFSPIQDLTGTITPADLAFERHHAGVAQVDPRRYKLLVHGLVDRPMVFSLDDLHRFPSVSRIHFLECSGNGRSGYRDPKPELTPQMIDGLVTNGEWTGVPLSILLDEVGVRKTGSWLLAEGGDAAKLSRSIPIAKAWDDAIVAYAFNGEPLRPANGFPARLFLPGFEANTCVKWLRRIELVDQPNMSRDETSKYTDPLPGGVARQFSFVMDAKSIITSPAYPQRVARGWLPVTGLAWSGRGRIVRVDVSTDGGASWTPAELQPPALPLAQTRFTLMWKWNGRPTRIMSRAVDETGYEQPTLSSFRERRGRGTDFHFNHIRTWRIERDGRVFYEGGA